MYNAGGLTDTANGVCLGWKNSIAGDAILSIKFDATQVRTVLFFSMVWGR